MEKGDNSLEDSEMVPENGMGRWKFGPNEALAVAGTRSIRATLGKVISCVDETGPKQLVSFGNGDPSIYPSFRTAPGAEDAIVEAVRSAKHNYYPPFGGVLAARQAVAEDLSKDLPYKLSPDDVFLTVGCQQAAEVVITALARPGANILIPRPGFPMYEARSVVHDIEIRKFNLIPEKRWEVDLDQVEHLADDGTIAIVIINPNNPCGNVYTYQHLEKIAETASKLGIMVIADETYSYSVFGTNPFVPMGAFGNIVPVLTLGSISKRWVVPGWRLGWIITTDPKGIFKRTKVVDAIKSYLAITTNPASFIQGAIPQIFSKTKDDFFGKITNLLREDAETCFNKIKDIKCMTCPHKPEGSMFVVVKLDLSYLEDINDDVDFCCKLAKEESVIICPGSALDMKNWLRITFAMELETLEVGLERLKSFCERHEKHLTNKQNFTTG